MHMQQISLPEKYRSSSGSTFEYVFYHHVLSSEHDYWLFTIQVSHPSWGIRPFGVYVTKQEVATQEGADWMTKTFAVLVALVRLEVSTEDTYRDVRFHVFNGWWVM